jgi:hypothetical protein
MIESVAACCVLVFAPMNLAWGDYFIHDLTFIGGEP